MHPTDNKCCIWSQFFKKKLEGPPCTNFAEVTSVQWNYQPCMEGLPVKKKCKAGRPSGYKIYYLVGI